MKKLLSLSSAVIVTLVLVPVALADAPAPMVQPSSGVQSSIAPRGIRTLGTGGNEWARINTNLPDGHPCDALGGEWRGWCMDIDGNMVMPSITPRPQVNARNLRDIEIACMDVADRTARRACYRSARNRLYGRTQGPRTGGGIGQLRMQRNIYYYITQ